MDGAALRAPVVMVAGFNRLLFSERGGIFAFIFHVDEYCHAPKWRTMKALHFCLSSTVDGHQFFRRDDDDDNDQYEDNLHNLAGLSTSLACLSKRTYPLPASIRIIK